MSRQIHKKARHPSNVDRSRYGSAQLKTSLSLLKNMIFNIEFRENIEGPSNEFKAEGIPFKQ